MDAVWQAHGSARGRGCGRPTGWGCCSPHAAMDG